MMLRVVLANLWAHKARLALSSLAITLGIGFVAGTLVFTGSMKATFYRAFATTSPRVAAVVTPSAHTHALLSPNEVRAARRVPGVADATGLVSGVVVLSDDQGHSISGGNLPTTVTAMPRDPGLRPTRLRSGHAPAAPDQLVIDRVSARSHHLSPGATVRVVGHASKRRANPTDRLFRVVGLTDTPPGANTGGIVLGTQPDVALRLTGRNRYSEIDAAAVAGVSQHELARRIASELGDGVRVRTGAQRRAAQVSERSHELDTLSAGLLVFAGVALLVAAVVIFNTFQVLATQRARELALLRCAGATRRQLFFALVGEAGLVGLAASTAGVIAGVGIGATLRATLGGSSADAGSVYPGAGTIAVSLLAGVLVTVLATMVPARRAAAVAPVAALRPRARRGHGLERWRIAAMTASFGAGLAVTATGIHVGGQAGIFAVAAGGCAVFSGVLVAGPIYVRVFARAVARPVARLFGVPGRLAMDNAARDPGRTAATTAALGVGITLVTLFSVLGTSMKASNDAALQRHFPVDYQVSSGTGDAVPTRVVARLRAAGPVARVATVDRRHVTVAGGNSQTAAIVDAADLHAVAPHLATRGSLNRLRDGTVAVASSLATRQHLAVGDTLRIRTRRAGMRRVTVVAIYDDAAFHYPLTVAGSPGATGVLALVELRAGASPIAARTAVNRAVRGYPQVQAMSLDQARRQLSSNIDRVIAAMYGLLGLAILIALLGIANTLALSVIERTRESALLRALGTTRRQLRRMLSLEAAAMSVLGALVGIVLGVGFGWAVVSALADRGAVFAIAYWQIALFVVAAAGCGLAAAVAPGRRMAKTSIVASLTEE